MGSDRCPSIGVDVRPKSVHPYSWIHGKIQTPALKKNQTTQKKTGACTKKKQTPATQKKQTPALNKKTIWFFLAAEVFFSTQQSTAPTNSDPILETIQEVLEGVAGDQDLLDLVGSALGKFFNK